MPPNDNSAPSGNARQSGGASAQHGGTHGAGGNEQPDGNQPVTMAQLEALENRVKESLAGTYQGIQGLLDRQSGSLRAAVEPVNQVLKVLEAQGVEIPEATKTAIRSQALDDALLGQGDDPGGSSGATGNDQAGNGAGGQGQTGTLGHLALQMFQQRGMAILANDPELALIDQETQDPQVFMSSVDKALNTKALRMAGDQLKAMGVELPETEDDETEAEPSGRTGPGVNLRGKGKKQPNLLPEQMPSGRSTTPEDRLRVGFEQATEFTK